MTKDKPDFIKPTRFRYRRRQPPELSATAHHEAGHAFADWLLHFPIEQVTIVPSDEAMGTATSKGRRVLRLLRRLEVDRPITGKQIGNCHDLVVTLLAGEEAQRRFDPKSIRKHHAAGDHDSVIEVLMRLHPDAEECRCAFRYLLARTRNLISNPWYWRRIEDLAKALIKRRTLTGEEVDDVLRASKQAQMEEFHASAK